MASHNTNIEFAKKKHYLVVQMPDEGSNGFPVIKGCYSYKVTAEAKSHGLLVITRKQWREQYPAYTIVLNEFEAKEFHDSQKVNPLDQSGSPAPQTTSITQSIPPGNYRTDLVISIDMLSDFEFTIPGVSSVPNEGNAFACHWESFISNEYILKFLKDFGLLAGNFFEVQDVGYTYFSNYCEVDFTIVKGN